MNLDGKTVGDLGEAWVIDTVRAHCPAPESPIGPGDDAAVLAGKLGTSRVVTADALVEGVHFLPEHPPQALGWKSLAVNLSDLAAMGAAPSEWLLTAVLPPRLPAPYWRELAIGMGACARHYGGVLVGGDTVRASGALMLSITAIGTLPARLAPLTRSGGASGDVLMVHGPIGRSGLGLRWWLQNPGQNLDDPCVRAHLRPTPDLAAGRFAVEHGATAAMDASDGLATDLPRLATASGVALEVDLDRLPDDASCRVLTSVERVASGEDYGLVVLVPPGAQTQFKARGFTALGSAVPATDAGTSVVWRSAGRVIDPPRPSFAHFD